MIERKIGAMTLTLPSDLEIVLTRSFDAPRGLVFEAFIKPEHVVRWWGCHGSSVPVCEIDLRLGGAYRFVMRGPDGQDHAFSGVYREIAPPERLAYTQTYEPYPGNELVETLIFTEENGKTTVTSTSLCESKEVRDMVLQSGMEGGAAESYDRLAELVESMAAAPAAANS